MDELVGLVFAIGAITICYGILTVLNDIYKEFKKKDEE
jgi:hypothetical protein